jgi:hypothetical protein
LPGSTSRAKSRSRKSRISASASHVVSGVEGEVVLEEHGRAPRVGRDGVERGVQLQAGLAQRRAGVEPRLGRRLDDVVEAVADQTSTPSP